MNECADKNESQTYFNTPNQVRLACLGRVLFKYLVPRVSNVTHPLRLEPFNYIVFFYFGLHCVHKGFLM
ncbi:hypothetical protein HanPI659440_Chr12g0457921 [Helianthus annuus]|nr:hypothetical protein HanPI659440_Chr12g0457921 [Helianthus annuus]